MKIGLLHYSGPPMIGGVEQTLFYQAKELALAGHEPFFIVGEGAAVVPESQIIRIPQLFSRHPDVLIAKEELDAGNPGAQYQKLLQFLTTQLSTELMSVDVLLVHNALTLHKNLALTQALWNLNQAGDLPPIVGWHHDFAWVRPDYSSELHMGSPWDLLKKPWPGTINVVVSKAQQQKLAKLYEINPKKIAVIPPGVDPAITGHWT